MFLTDAYIHSLKGAKRQVKILEKVGDNDYIAEYAGIKCHAMFNWFVGMYYVDDIYGVIDEE
jgi:hypothetical protein